MGLRPLSVQPAAPLEYLCGTKKASQKPDMSPALPQLCSSSLSHPAWSPWREATVWGNFPGLGTLYQDLEPLEPTVTAAFGRAPTVCRHQTRPQDPALDQKTELAAKRNKMPEESRGKTASLLSLTLCSFFLLFPWLLAFGRIWRGVTSILPSMAAWQGSSLTPPGFPGKRKPLRRHHSQSPPPAPSPSSSVLPTPHFGVTGSPLLRKGN